MKESLSTFFKNLKIYMDYIMTLDFKKLGIHFISLVFIVFISLLVYIPIDLVNDFVINLIGGLYNNAPVIVYTVISLVFELISIVCCFATFVYLFNGRYKSVYDNEINESTKDKKEIKLEEEEFVKVLEEEKEEDKREEK